MSESQSEAVGPAAEALVQRAGRSAWGASYPSQMCGDRTAIGSQCHLGEEGDLLRL